LGKKIYFSSVGGRECFFFSIERVSFAIGFVLISNALFLVTADVFFFLSIFGCFFFFSVRLWVIFILFFCRVPLDVGLIVWFSVCLSIGCLFCLLIGWFFLFVELEHVSLVFLTV
jgi:hypothetical protein